MKERIGMGAALHGSAAASPGRRGTVGWRLAYLLGATPWERGGAAGAAGIDRLVAREAGDRAPYGRLLDIGCGAGGHAVRLAQAGWDVTGIDVVPRAIARARARAATARARITWAVCDVADLRREVRPGFRVVLDVGCFHALDDRRRHAYAEEVTAVADPGAALLMLAFAPRQARRPGPRGVTTEEIIERLPGWHLERETVDHTPLPRMLRGAGPRWLTLRKIA